jgi:uncharacterized membrane protein YeaQ/YmgE (transglycosylase-associated protein family)
MLGTVLGLLVIGFVIGFIARAVVAGRLEMSILHHRRHRRILRRRLHRPHPLRERGSLVQPSSWIGSITGAVLVLMVYLMIMGRAQTDSWAAE